MWKTLSTMWKTKMWKLWKTQTLVDIKDFHMWKTMWITCGKLFLAKTYPHTFPQFYPLLLWKTKKCKVLSIFRPKINPKSPKKD